MSKPVRPQPVPNEPGRWLVQSATDPPDPWLVDMNDEEYGIKCGCPGWHFYHEKMGPGWSCRHIRAVVREMARLKRKAK
jgi:hypothetical protein